MLVAGLAIAGCATKTGTGAGVGAGVGAAVGAGAGQAIGRSTEATLLGAGIGAVVGGLTGAAIGSYMDKQEQAMRQAVANSEAATVRREQEIVQGARQQTVEVLTVSFKSDYLFATDSTMVMPGAQPETPAGSRCAQAVSRDKHPDSRSYRQPGKRGLQSAAFRKAGTGGTGRPRGDGGRPFPSHYYRLRRIETHSKQRYGKRPPAESEGRGPGGAANDMRYCGIPPGTAFYLGHSC